MEKKKKLKTVKPKAGVKKLTEKDLNKIMGGLVEPAGGGSCWMMSRQYSCPSA